MALTSTVCYYWAKAKFITKTPVLPGIIGGFIVAVVVHGLFDYFILTKFVQVGILSMVILIGIASVYGKMLNNGLNFSTFYDDKRLKLLQRRLDNYLLLATTALATMLIVYLYNYTTFTTVIANNALVKLGIQVVLGLIIFGALGEFHVTPGKLRPLTEGLPKSKKAQRRAMEHEMMNPDR